MNTLQFKDFRKDLFNKYFKESVEEHGGQVVALSETITGETVAFSVTTTKELSAAVTTWINEYHELADRAESQSA